MNAKRRPDLLGACSTCPDPDNLYCLSAGVQFLFRQYSRDQGAILADDMGLGKTIQTIAFCAAVLGKAGSSEDDFPRDQVAGKRQVELCLH